MERQALMIIDMQNDFIDRGSTLEVRNIRDGIPRLKEFVEKIRKKGILIIYTRHLYDGKPNPAEEQLFPDVVMKTLHDRTHGAEICKSIRPRADDIIIDKHRYDAFHKTRLNSILKRHNITELIISGTMTDVCCACTAHAAMMNDYKIILVSDLTFTSRKTAQQATLRNIKSHFGRVLTSKQVLKELTSKYYKKNLLSQIKNID